VVGQFFELSGAARFYPGAEEPLVLSVGFPFQVKGFDVLCEAFKRVASQFPRWKLVLIGHHAPQELREGGFQHPQIEALPGLRQPEVAQWMSRCAIFALPSRTEAMGRVLIEAGAAAKCRLATRVDGIPTVVEDEVDGVLVEKENVEQLANALERLMGNPELRGRLGEAARERVATEFSPARYLEHYVGLVSSALGRREQ
jgi:glycosyltransferase involved in cell wall biosynthesis